MTGFAIIVDFHLKPGARSAFRQLIDMNARISVQAEHGCRRFDVVEPRDEADRVLLYEIYDDDFAFEAHVSSPHYVQFDAESAPLIVDKSVIRCDLVCEGTTTTAR
jgi:autoinducer 2-degrading protein